MDAGSDIWSSTTEQSLQTQPAWPVMVDDEGEIEDEDFLDDEEDQADALADDEDDFFDDDEDDEIPDDEEDEDFLVDED